MQNYIEYIKYAVYAVAIAIAFGLGLAWPIVTGQPVLTWPWLIGGGCIVGWLILEKLVAPLILVLWRLFKLAFKPIATTLIIIIVGFISPIQKAYRLFAPSK